MTMATMTRRLLISRLSRSCQSRLVGATYFPSARRWQLRSPARLTREQWPEFGAFGRAAALGQPALHQGLTCARGQGIAGRRAADQTVRQQRLWSLPAETCHCHGGCRHCNIETLPVDRRSMDGAITSAAEEETHATHSCGRRDCCHDGPHRAGVRPDQGTDVLEPLGGRDAEARRSSRSRDQGLRGQEPRHQAQADLVREDRALCRSQDGAARRPGAGHLLCRAGSGRVHGERLPARSLGPQWGGSRALGQGGLELQGQALRPAARGLDGRALLQQEDHGRARREGPGQPAACARRFPRHGQEGEGQRHHADGARRRRPAVSGRACRARSRC